MNRSLATPSRAERTTPTPAAPVLQRQCACGTHTPSGGECASCAAKKRQLQRRAAFGSEPEGTVAPPIVHEVLRRPGRPLDQATRAFFEPRFGHDFSHVRVHTDPQAAESAAAVNALAYTVGRDVVIRAGQYAPDSASGRQLLAHELTHVVQQSSGRTGPHSKLVTSSPSDFSELEASKVSHAVANTTDAANYLACSTIRKVSGVLQRTIGDGHDLTSARFSRLIDLEAAYDDEAVIRRGSSGRGVQAIQQALYDLGFPLPASGADGVFSSETEAAVKAFQSANPPLVSDGEIGENTMTVLDARFGAPVLPPPAVRAAPWTEACVRSVLCPWSPHTVEVLRTRITLKSFDSISWADERWDGAAWVPAPFPGAGYNTGVEIGVLNSSCEEMAETLYHEVLHAEQPTRHSTTLQSESYAYRIGEEFSIAMGLAGRPSLRSTDPRGRQFADPAKVRAFVSTQYPSVPAGGVAEEIIGKAGAVGDVRVQRPDGSIYTRPAVVGETVPGPRTTVGAVVHPAAGWTCP